MCSLFSRMSNSSSQDLRERKSVFKNVIEAKLNSPIMMLTFIFLPMMQMNIKSLTRNVSDGLCIYRLNPSGEEPKEACLKGDARFSLPLTFKWTIHLVTTSAFQQQHKGFPKALQATIATCRSGAKQKHAVVQEKFFLFSSLSLF